MIHTGRPFTTTATFLSFAPLRFARTAVIGSCNENVALPEMTLATPFAPPPASTFLTSNPCLVKNPRSMPT